MTVCWGITHPQFVEQFKFSVVITESSSLD